MPSKSNLVRLPRPPGLSSEDCRLLVESVLDYAIFMLDPEGKVATWNSGAARLKGYAVDEIVGKHFSLFYTAEDSAAGKPALILERARHDGRVEDESWRVRKDGSRFWANVVVTALRDPQGRLVGYGKVTRDLTGRHQAEQQLKDSEERFRLLVESVADYAIYMLDLTGRVTTWNLGAARLTGYAAEEIIGKHFSVFFPEQDAQSGKPDAELDVARRVGRCEAEGWRVRKDGSRFWALAVVTPLRAPGGELIGFAKVTRDLTARQEAEVVTHRLLQEQAARERAETAERQLRESEERYRALSQRLEIVLEGVADGITVQDSSGRVVFANNAAARICGFSSGLDMMRTGPGEIVARFEILDEQGRPVDLARLPGRRVLAGEPAGDALLHVRHRETGRQWWTVVRASAVLAADGSPELAVNIWHDVTAERRRELQAKYLADATTALSSSLDVETMLATLARVLVPGLADWCTIHVLEGDRLRSAAVAHVDPAKLARAQAYQQRFPPDPDQPRGVWNVIRTGQTELYDDITDEMLVRAARHADQLEILRAAGMKASLLVAIQLREQVLGAITLVSAESGKRFDASEVALVEELGRRAAVALDNAHLYAAAQHAAKTAEEAARSRDDFLATVSHELRTPLNAILGWATLLRSKHLDPTLDRPLDVIYRNARAQVAIVDAILDESNAVTGKLRLKLDCVNLVEVVQQAVESVQPSARAKHLEVDLLVGEDALWLVGDAERLQQVAWNLLSNAVKFTDRGGRVRVELRREGEHISLSVSDTGEGIAPEFVPHLFERFRQADATTTRRVGGLGLGLALVRHIVELHGGRVTAESEGRGKGAQFSVWLPASELRAP